MIFLLECEKKISEISKKIEELKKFSEEKNIDLSLEINEFEKKLKELKESEYKNLTPMDKLMLSRMIERPTALDYIERIFDGFIEFHGDRYFGDDACIIGGIGKLNGMPCTIIIRIICILQQKLIITLFRCGWKQALLVCWLS